MNDHELLDIDTWLTDYTCKFLKLQSAHWKERRLLHYKKLVDGSSFVSSKTRMIKPVSLNFT